MMFTNMRKRWLVTFTTTMGAGPFDATLVDVRAPTELAAIARAKREVMHPWRDASACAWPRDCADVDAAIERLASAP